MDNKETIKNLLSKDDIDKIADAAEESRLENDMLKIKKELEDLDNSNAPLIKDEKIGDIYGKISDLTTDTIDTMPTRDVSLFDIEGDNVPLNNEIPEGSIAEMAKDNYDLSDDEVLLMLTTISEMKKNPNYPVYKNLPDKLKEVVKEVAAKNNIPIQHYNDMARMLMMEFMNDSEVNSAFIDLERSLDMALNIPSIIDLYTEHTRTVMEDNIPKMIEQIKDTDPDKALMLEMVKKNFSNSYTFAFAKKEYESNARLRKFIRKRIDSVGRLLDEFNFRNEKSNFKMNDVKEIPIILSDILIDEPIKMNNSCIEDGVEVPELTKRLVDMKITDTDIDKFCILICKSCENLNPRDVIDASYMYYMMKNIIVLKHTNEAKTDFSVELINNICDTITFIRNKEAEFNEANMDKSKL